MGDSGVRWLKVNVDASMFSEATFFTVRVVLRDEQGNFICGKNMRIGGQVSVLEAEVIGVLEAVKWMEESGKQHVIVETDSLLVVQALQQSKVY